MGRTATTRGLNRGRTNTGCRDRTASSQEGLGLNTISLPPPSAITSTSCKKTVDDGLHGRLLHPPTTSTTMWFRLNSHLEKLGWMAKLTKDERWVLTVFPAPERQFPRSNTMLLFWVLSLLTLTLAGDHWMSNARPTEGWFHSSAFLDALLGYTLPILVVLFASSLVQRTVARRYGVRSGHLMPVPDFTIALYALGLFPSNWMFWPFGLLLIPTMPRMDARPWPDRASLGYTALTVPLVLGGAGAVLMIAGMSMTPEYLASAGMPLVSAPPLFPVALGREFPFQRCLHSVVVGPSMGSCRWDVAPVCLDLNSPDSHVPWRSIAHRSNGSDRCTEFKHADADSCHDALLRLRVRSF